MGAYSIIWKNMQSQIRKNRQVMVPRIMGKSMLGIWFCKHIWSEVVQEESGVKDVITEYWKEKSDWVGLVTRFPDNRWICAVVGWYPRDLKWTFRKPLWWEKWFRPIRARSRIKWKCIITTIVENTKWSCQQGKYFGVNLGVRNPRISQIPQQSKKCGNLSLDTRYLLPKPITRKYLYYFKACVNISALMLNSHNDINNNNNNTNTGGMNEFISFYLQSLVTRGERHKS